MTGAISIEKQVAGTSGRYVCRWTFWCEILDCVFSMAWRNA